MKGCRLFCGPVPAHLLSILIHHDLQQTSKRRLAGAEDVGGKLYRLLIAAAPQLSSGLSHIRPLAMNYRSA